MKRDLPFLMLSMLLLASSFAISAEKEEKKVPAALDFKLPKLDGKPGNLADYQGKVVLIVNVASKCGLTPQYEGLEALHEKYHEKGLVVAGFPANEFGKQEPGTDKEIASFCEKNFGVKFDMYSKVVVKGPGQTPLYKFLTSKDTNPKFAGDIKWNFEKFVIGRNGEVVARFDPKTEPDDEAVLKVIEDELAKK